MPHNVSGRNEQARREAAELLTSFGIGAVLAEDVAKRLPGRTAKAFAVALADLPAKTQVRYELGTVTRPDWLRDEDDD